MISLEPIQQRDLESLFVRLNDSHAATLDLLHRPLDCIALRDWLDRLPRETSQILFAIREMDRPGMIRFVLFKNFQPVYQAAELRVRIGVESERGKGYGTRAVRLALDYAWRVLNLHRISLHALAHNECAIASHNRAGFAAEGGLCEAAFIDGPWRDVVVMGALRSSAGACSCWMRRRLPHSYPWAVALALRSRATVFWLPATNAPQGALVAGHQGEA